MNFKKEKSGSVEMARKTMCSSDKKGSRKKHGVSNNVNSSGEKKRAYEGVIVNKERGSKRLKVQIRERGDTIASFSKVFFFLIFEYNLYVI